MNKARTVIGAQAFFFPAGLAFTVPTAGTASRTAKPGGADVGWLEPGVSDWTFAPTNESEEFFAPAPGVRVLWDLITTKQGLTLKGKWMEMSNIVYKMLLGANDTLPLTGVGGQYNPLGGDPIIRGWLQLQQYNRANALINTMDVFVAMQIPGDVAFGDKPVDVDVEAKVLFSALNSGSLA